MTVLYRCLLAVLLLGTGALTAQAAPVTVVNAGQPLTIASQYTVVNAQTINGTGTYTSNAVDLGNAQYFGAWYKCTSAAGAPDVTLTWEESPTSEGDDFVFTTTIKANLTAETAQLNSFSPPPMRFGRAKVAGNVGNPTDTLCTVKLFIQGIRP